MARRGTWGKSIGLGIALILATALAYFPMNWAGALYDDADYLTENLVIRDPGGLWKIFFLPRASPQYYPLVFAGFWAEYRLWGFDLPSYHRVNVALHALNAVLVWRVARRLLPAGGWLAGAIFALHPVNVESVAWIAERKNVLSGFFYLLALLAYWRFEPPGRGPSEVASRNRWIWYTLAFVLFACALGSKTVTCSLPAAILLIAWGRSGRVGIREVGPLVPFFGLGLLACGMTSWMERGQSALVASELVFSPLDRALIAGRSLWFTAAKLAWPLDLALVYPRWRINPREWWQDAYPLAVLGLVAGLWAARSRIGRWPLVGVLFFAGTLVPTLGFVSFYYFIISFVADRFSYLAGLGLILPAAWGVARIGQRVDRRLPRAGTALIAALVLALGAATALRAFTFADRELIWTETLARNPESWLAMNNLGSFYLERGKTARAEACFRSAIQLRPTLSEAYTNLGYVLWSRHEEIKAEANFRKALELNPYDWRPRFPLGAIYDSLGQKRQAAEQLRLFLLYEPNHPGARTILGRIEADPTQAR